MNRFGVVFDTRLEDGREKIKNRRLTNCKYLEVFMIMMTGKPLSTQVIHNEIHMDEIS